MQARVSQAASTLRTIGSRAQDAQLTFLAAAIAYYAFVSFLPLILLALSLAAIVGGEAFSTRVIAILGQFLTEEAEGLAQNALSVDAAAGGVTVVGLAALTWSGLKLFRGLDTAFSTVYGTTTSLGLLDQIRDGLLVLVSIVVGVTAIALTSIFAERLAARFVPGLASLLLFLTLFVAFFPVYYVFPSTDVGVREVVPGTAFAAVGWLLLSEVFRAYAAVASTSVYGVLGAAVLIVTWFYFGAVVVLLGAVVNATLADRTPTADRKPQHPGLRQFAPTEMAPEQPEEVEGGARSPEELEPEEAEAVRTELDQLWDQLHDVEGRLDEKTVSRSEFEAEMRRYVRKRQRRGHARGWGPYLVLLYGTAMTLGAFFYLDGLWAILAMIVVWLSTLGLYGLMVLVGAATGGLSAVGRLRDTLGSLRS